MSRLISRGLRRSARRLAKEAQKRAYIIADNQLALNAGWEDEALRAELAALQAEDFDLCLVGFDTHELDELLLGDAVEEGEDIVHSRTRLRFLEDGAL